MKGREGTVRFCIDVAVSIIKLVEREGKMAERFKEMHTTTEELEV
jgi:hypothetical protein